MGSLCVVGGCALGAGSRVRSRSLGSFGCVLGIIGFIRCRWVHSGAPFRLSGSLGCSLGVVMIIRGHSGAPCGSLSSLGVVGFVPMRLGDHWVHSVLLGSALGVVVLIRGHWVLSGVLWWSSASLCAFGCALVVVGLIWVRPVGRWFHEGSLGSFGSALVVIGHC